MIPLLCTLLSGAGFYFSIQLGSIWALAWVAPIPLWWLAYGERPWWQVLLACWAAYAIGMCNMLPAYAGQLPTPILVFAIGLPGLIFGGTALVARLVARRLTPLAGPGVAAALWTSLDYAFSFGPNGTAASWAYSQVGAPVLIQSASLFGLWIITFALVFFSSGIALALVRREAMPAVVAVMLFAANADYGYVRLASAIDGERVRIGLGADDRQIFPPDEKDAALHLIDEYVTQARTLGQAGARLIVFPEKVAVLLPEWRDEALAKLRRAASESNATIVIGFDDRGTATRRNNALIFTPDGAAPSEYHKHHMVPGLEQGFVPGQTSLTLPGGTGVAICKDMDFPATLRAATAANPTLMLVPAWDFRKDAWWHARLAIMRSVENGFALARSAKEGLLTLSDGYGRIVAQKATRPEGPTAVTQDLPRGPGVTLYQSIGDLFAFGAIAVALALPCAALARGDNRRPVAPSDQSA